MPVPQEMNFLVEQASCLLLTMVQDLILQPAPKAKKPVYESRSPSPLF